MKVGKGAREIVGARRAANQQFTIHDAFKIDGIEHVGKCARNIVAGAGVEFARLACAGKLHTDAVPFPLGRIIGRVQTIEIAVCNRGGQHYRVKDGGRRQNRPLGLALEPGEKRRVRRRQTVPEGFDFDDVLIREIRQCLPRQPRRNADAKAAGCEFQEGETRGGIEPVEQIAHRSAHFGAAERIHQRHDFAKTGILRLGIIQTADIAPDQRDGLGQVADIIV